MELSSLEGRLLAGRFQLGKLLGQGGYGAVFKAEQVSMGRPCAVKVLAPHLVSSDETVKRFELEARATSRLTHSNTIVVYDFGRDSEAGLLFLAMEYLDGDDLDRYVKRYGPMTVQPGLVHRDVKPKNAMVTERGADPMFVKLIDFGISKAFDPIAHQRTSFLELTGTGMVVGTPQYMSPEQLRNDPVDGRSDQYSLAITAYRILTGRTPFQGASLVDVAVKHISDSPLPLRAYRPDLSVPADFEGVLLQALSKDPANRFDSMQAFAHALRASVEGVEGPKPPTSREPWADAETGSMSFAVDEIDETENMAGEAIPEHVDPDEAFAPTAGLEAQGDDETPVHLGGTLARNRGGQDDVNTDDVPGSTLVVLREESGQSDRADAADDISFVDGESGDAVGAVEPRQVTGEVPVESPSGEWKLGDVAVDRPPEANDTLPADLRNRGGPQSSGRTGKTPDLGRSAGSMPGSVSGGALVRGVLVTVLVLGGAAYLVWPGGARKGDSTVAMTESVSSSDPDPWPAGSSEAPAAVGVAKEKVRGARSSAKSKQNISANFGFTSGIVSGALEASRLKTAERRNELEKRRREMQPEVLEKERGVASKSGSEPSESADKSDTKPAVSNPAGPESKKAPKLKKKPKRFERPEVWGVE